VSRFEFAPAKEAAPDHPLAGIDGARVPGGRLAVSLGPRIVGGRYFRLAIGDGDRASRFVQGLYNAGGYPGQNWAEVFDIDPPDGVSHGDGWELKLKPYLEPLAGLIPPGGHLMIEYEKPEWRSTQLGLLAGIPPLATPMGELLFELDCGDSFKDWYFPEGGQEGGRKLQGNKAYSAEQREEFRAKRAAELRKFLEGPTRGAHDLDAAARAAARRVLKSLGA